MTLLFFLFFLMFSWGIGNVFVKKGLSRLTPWQIYALDTFATAIPIWLIYGYLNGGNLLKITLPAVLIAFLTTITYGLQYVAMSAGEISLTTSIIATYPLFTLLFAIIILKEKLTLLAYAAIFLTLLGIYLISLPKKVTLKWEKWVLISLVVAIGYGIEAVLAKIVLRTIDNASYLMLLAVMQAVVVILWRLFAKDPLPNIKTKASLYSLIGLTLFNLGNIVYYQALDQNFASLIVPLSNTYVLVTIILSVIWLKEKITRLQLAGILSVVIGIIILGFTSGSLSQNSIATILENREQAHVKKVFDGDTIELSDGRRVRYMGIDTPEIYKDDKTVECFAKEAKKINEDLVKNQTIEMEKDLTDKDKYGRLLRYVFADNIFVNEFLVQQGAARTNYIPPDKKYASEFKNAQKEARDNNSGLWQACH